MKPSPVTDDIKIQIFFHSISPQWTKRDDETIRQCLRMMDAIIAARDAQWEQMLQATTAPYVPCHSKGITGMVYDITGAEPPPPDSGFARLGEFE